MITINNVILTKNEIDCINNILIQHFNAEIQKSNKKNKWSLGIMTGLMGVVALDGIRSHDFVISVIFGLVTTILFACFLFTCFQKQVKMNDGSVLVKNKIFSKDEVLPIKIIDQLLEHPDIGDVFKKSLLKFYFIEGDVPVSLLSFIIRNSMLILSQEGDWPEVKKYVMPSCTDIYIIPSPLRTGKKLRGVI